MKGSAELPNASVGPSPAAPTPLQVACRHLRSAGLRRYQAALLPWRLKEDEGKPLAQISDDILRFQGRGRRDPARVGIFLVLLLNQNRHLIFDGGQPRNGGN